MRRKKQKIKFDYSLCKYPAFERKITRFNSPCKSVFVEPISDKLDFYYCKNNKVVWVKKDQTPDVPKEDTIYSMDSLFLRVRSKKALLRQIRRLKFPKGFTFLVDPRVYYSIITDCNFLCYIRSDPK